MIRLDLIERVGDSARTMAARVTSSHGQARRRLMKALAASGGVFAAATMVPTRWTRPIIETISVPLHAQGSAELVIGLFTTTAGAGFSFLDSLVQPLYAAPIGTVTVGNAAFSLSWDIDSDGYSICGQGSVNNGSPEAFKVSGGGERSGNQLENFSQSIPGGTLSITNQVVSVGSLTFVAGYQSSQAKASAFPGGGCFSNSTNTLTLSSPYPDENPS